MQKKHIELVEAVNSAKSVKEHERAEAVLEGYRLALDEQYGPGTGLMDCDRHYMALGVNRPMCCGVFLDWKPTTN